MSIFLQVVGLVYRRSGIPFQIPSGKTVMTVKDVLDYAAQNKGGTSDAFGYISSGEPLVNGSTNESVTAFFARFFAEHKSLTSGATYPAGEYFLSESTVGNPRYSVWQYYITKADGTRRKLNSPTESFASQAVEDGDTVIWRLVEILSGPNPAPTVYRSKLGLKDS